MRKIMIGMAVLAVVIFAAGVSFAGFGGIKVPTSVSDVTDAPKDAAYDECKVWASGHKNNMSFNSTNIESAMGSEFSGTIYEKDWRKSGSKYDKENKRLEMRSTFNKLSTIKIRCNKEKCSNMSCSK